METVNIAVIGADGVGKSAFIQRALSLPRPPGLNVTTVRLEVDAVHYLVTIVELDIEGFELMDISKEVLREIVDGDVVNIQFISFYEE